MNVLVDTSIWIDYFGGRIESEMDFLIEEGLVAVNDLVLAELIPFLKIRRKLRLYAG